jgi:hypothetical protein
MYSINYRRLNFDDFFNIPKKYFFRSEVETGKIKKGLFLRDLFKNVMLYYFPY